MKANFVKPENPYYEIVFLLTVQFQPVKDTFDLFEEVQRNPFTKNDSIFFKKEV